MKLGILSTLLFFICLPTMAATELNWIIAHEPISVFERSAKYFSNIVEKETEGRVKVNVLTYKEYTGKVRLAEAQELIIDKLKKNELQMSQMYLSSLSEINPEFNALMLPMIFRDHDHVEKVVTGAIGKKIMNGLSSESGIQALAFTYSGGKKVIATKDKMIKTAADFKNLVLRPWEGELNQEILKSLDVKFSRRHYQGKPVSLESTAKAKIANGGETTIALLDWLVEEAKTKEPSLNIVNETFHAVHLTTLIIGKKFMNSLSPRDQNIIRKAAEEAARMERRQSIADAARIKRELKGKVQFVTLNTTERKKLRQRFDGIYQKIGGKIGTDIIEEIEQL